MQIMQKIPDCSLQRPNEGPQEATGDVTCSQKDIEGGRVPGQDSHPLAVSLQDHNGLSHRARQASVWDLPNLQTQRAHTDL